MLFQPIGVEHIEGAQVHDSELHLSPKVGELMNALDLNVSEVGSWGKRHKEINIFLEVLGDERSTGEHLGGTF